MENEPSNEQQQQQQHNWNTRGRLRAKARYAIQQRMTGPTGSTTATATSLHPPTTTTLNTTVARIQDVLWRIIRNDLSIFSLPSIATQYEFLQQPFPTCALWWTNADGTTLLAGEQPLQSRFGYEHVQRLRTLAGCSSMETTTTTCTFIEYACWMQRYSVVGLLLVGGVHPFSDDERGQALFALQIPLSMKRYMVQRLVERRVETILRRRDLDEHETADVPCCDMCEQPSASAAPLQNAKCSHSICESCLWYHVTRTVHVERECCFDCPVCFDATAAGATSLELGTAVERAARATATCQAYAALPVDAQALKQQSRRKKRKPILLAPNWTTAVPDLIGSSQTVRADRFWSALAAQQVPIVRACLEAGMDVRDSTMREGKTPLLLAVFSNAVACARLLVYYGCHDVVDVALRDADAAGVTTCWDVAIRWGYTELIELLREVGAEVCGRSILRPREPFDARGCHLETLVGWSEKDCAGAGSFVMDEFVSEQFIAALVSVWKSLPLEPLPKKKEQTLCSRRSYYFDACGDITEILADAISKALGIEENSTHDDVVRVHPSMRFLCYLTAGTILSPHIDLSRTDHHTSKRSTHSFLFYLTDCAVGGETVLLRGLTGPDRWDRLATVQPRMGRLLLFPHVCPHEGVEVESVPKLLIRGEVYIPR